MKALAIIAALSLAASAAYAGWFPLAGQGTVCTNVLNFSLSCNSQYINTVIH